MTGCFRLLSVFWMSVIFYFSSLNVTTLKSLPNISDILAHGAVYGILGIFLYFSFKKHPTLKTVIISFLYGVSDEFHQSFVPGRTPELKDLIVDCVAASLAILLIKTIYFIKKTGN